VMRMSTGACVSEAAFQRASVSGPRASVDDRQNAEDHRALGQGLLDRPLEPVEQAAVLARFAEITGIVPVQRGLGSADPAEHASAGCVFYPGQPAIPP
jgi:hypothetical protein